MKRLIFMALILSTGFAQNVITYYAEDLAVVEGLIEVTPGYPTTIELYDQGDIVLSGDDNETFLIEDLADQISIKTTASKGNVGLKLMVRGRRLLFDVRVNTQDPKNRVYEVLQDRGRAYAPSAELNFNVPVDQTSAAAQSEQAPQTPQVTGEGTLQLRPTPVDTQGNLTVFFTFQNGTQRLALDPTRLSVEQNGEPLNVQVTKEPLSNLLSPQETQNGLLEITQVTPGPVTVAWEVVTLSERGGEAWFIEEVVNAQ